MADNNPGHVFRGQRQQRNARQVMPTSKPAHILVVDDDPRVTKLLRELFTAEGFIVSEAQDGTTMYACLNTQAVDLITLDLKLGGEDGLSLAREIRSKHNVPIIIITGKAKVIDRVAGLELGVDDYITKPFNLREVLARVRAVLRRYTAPAAQPAETSLASYAFDGWVLEQTRRQLVSAAGEVVPFTTADFNLLEVFVNNPQRVLSRDNIMNMLKGHSGKE
jgi:two-component system OmpR family response regulator